MLERQISGIIDVPKAKHFGISARSAAKWVSILFSLTATMRHNMAETSVRYSTVISACVPLDCVSEEQMSLKQGELRSYSRKIFSVEIFP